MDPAIVVGSASADLGEALARALGQAPTPCRTTRFPDGELEIELGAPLHDRDAVVVQSTAPPVGEHLVELALLVDACASAGARSVTAIVPYLGYARHDKPAVVGRAHGLRVTAAMLPAALRRIVTIDPHSAAAAVAAPVPVESLSAAPLLADAVRGVIGGPAVVVSPDLGGAKRASAFAAALRLPLAVVHKARLGGAAVEAHAVLGDVRGRQAVIVDDLIATGETIAAAAGALRAAGATGVAAVAATHALLVGRAPALLAGIGAPLFTTDSVRPAGEAGALAPRVVSLATLLATALRAAHHLP